LRHRFFHLVVNGTCFFVFREKQALKPLHHPSDHGQIKPPDHLWHVGVGDTVGAAQAMESHQESKRGRASGAI